jgi:hypothetical protein
VEALQKKLLEQLIEYLSYMTVAVGVADPNPVHSAFLTCGSVNGIQI